MHNRNRNIFINDIYIDIIHIINIINIMFLSPKRIMINSQHIRLWDTCMINMTFNHDFSNYNYIYIIYKFQLSYWIFYMYGKNGVFKTSFFLFPILSESPQHKTWAGRDACFMLWGFGTPKRDAITLWVRNRVTDSFFVAWGWAFFFARNRGIFLMDFRVLGSSEAPESCVYTCFRDFKRASATWLPRCKYLLNVRVSGCSLNGIFAQL